MSGEAPAASYTVGRAHSNLDSRFGTGLDTIRQHRVGQLAGRILAVATVASGAISGFVAESVTNKPREAEAAEYLDEDGRGFTEYGFDGTCEDGEATLHYTFEVTDNDDEEEEIAEVGLMVTDSDGEKSMWHNESIEQETLYSQTLPWEEVPQQEDGTIVISQKVNLDSDDIYWENDSKIIEGPTVEEAHPCGQDGPEYTVNMEEIAGNTAGETAVLNSREHFPNGETDMAVIATDQEYADALAGGPLAGAVNGPILYAGRERLYNITAEELDRLNTQEVLLLGGRKALSADVERQIRDMGIDVTRLAGPTRLETAVAIEEHMDGHTSAVSNKRYLVYGWKFADAVAVSGLASQEGAPIQLTAKDELSETTRRHLEHKRGGVDTVTAVGGTAVVQSHVLEKAGDAAEGHTERLAGDNRYQTAEEVAKVDFNRHGNEAQDAQASMYMTPADTFYGTLAAAPLESRNNNAALMPIPEGDVDLLSSFQGVVEEFKHTSWERALIVGSVRDRVQERAEDILDSTSPVND